MLKSRLFMLLVASIEFTLRDFRSFQQGTMDRIEPGLLVLIAKSLGPDLGCLVQLLFQLAKEGFACSGGISFEEMGGCGVQRRLECACWKQGLETVAKGRSSTRTSGIDQQKNSTIPPPFFNRAEKLASVEKPERIQLHRASWRNFTRHYGADDVWKVLLQFTNRTRQRVTVPTRKNTYQIRNGCGERRRMTKLAVERGKRETAGDACSIPFAQGLLAGWTTHGWTEVHEAWADVKTTKQFA